MAEKEWKMRRKDRQTTEAEARKIAQNGSVGVLATTGAEGEPYAVPLSYVLQENRLYFHCAKQGRKLENIFGENRVCFVVVGENHPVYQKDFTTLYESVVIEGKASMVEEKEEKTNALLALCEKYLPGDRDKAPGDIQKSFSVTQVVRVDIETISGKAKR